MKRIVFLILLGFYNLEFRLGWVKTDYFHMTGGITSYPSYFRVPSGYHAVISPGWFTWIPPHHSSEVWRDDLMRTDLQLIAVHRREVRGQTFPWRANMTGDEVAKSFEEICWTVNGWDFPDLIDCSFCWFWEIISTHPKIRTWSEHDPTRYPTSFLVIQSCGLHHKLHPKKTSVRNQFGGVTMCHIPFKSPTWHLTWHLCARQGRQNRRRCRRCGVSFSPGRITWYVRSSIIWWYDGFVWGDTFRYPIFEFY